jgi:hypothetical protein
MKGRAWHLLLLCVCFAALPVSGQATQRAESLPDGSVLLSPQALSSIDASLSLLEDNLGKQRRLLASLSNELNTAESSLTTLRGLYNEQSVLVMSLKVWADQLGERLSASDQFLAWAIEDATILEGSLAVERANNTRLDRSARFWRTVAVVAGVLAVGAGVAAVVW